jgi:superfamily II DNA/RNA helicase
MPPEIQRITEAFLHNPVKIEIARQASTAETINQLLVAAPHNAAEKREVLRKIMRESEDVKNGIIFCNRKSDVQIILKSLLKHGFNVAALHGDMDQRARTIALDGFRAGTTQYLVASDVAARGLDIPDVSHVFNYDAPHHAEDYVHRIGRTGRAGRKGTAYTLITPEDSKVHSAIEAMIKRAIPWLGVSIDDAKFEPAPRRERGGRSGAKPQRARSEPKREPRAERETIEHVAQPEMVRAESVRTDTRRAEPVRMEQPRSAPRPPRPNHRNERRDDDGPTPKGFGNELPGFMMTTSKK